MERRSFCKVHKAALEANRAKSLRQVTHTLAPTVRALLELAGSKLGPEMADEDKEQVLAILKGMTNIAHWGDEARQLLCEQFVQDLPGQPCPADQFLDNFATIPEELGVVTIDWMVELPLHNNTELRVACLTKLLKRFSLYAQECCKQEECPSLEALLHRWAMQLLSYKQVCVEAAKAGVLFSALIDSIYLVLSLSASEDPYTGCSRIELDDKVVQQQVVVRRPLISFSVLP